MTFMQDEGEKIRTTDARNSLKYKHTVTPEANSISSNRNISTATSPVIEINNQNSVVVQSVSAPIEKTEAVEEITSIKYSWID